MSSWVFPCSCRVLVSAGLAWMLTVACSRNQQADPTKVESHPAQSAAAPVPPSAVEGRPGPGAVSSNTSVEVAVNLWSEAHNLHDALRLRGMYAPMVDYYGQSITRDKVTEAKAQAFSKAPDFRQSLVDIEVHAAKGESVVRFAKTWIAGGKVKTIGASITFESRDGRLVITRETDESVKHASIRCGQEVCSKVCCASFDARRCAESPSDCETADNGEGTFWLCDGPEDCASGEVCCATPGDRLQVVTCAPRASCTGSYQPPRYGGSIPLRIVCQSSSDCPSGTSCGSSDELVAAGLSVCR